MANQGPDRGYGGLLAIIFMLLCLGCLFVVWYGKVTARNP